MKLFLNPDFIFTKLNDSLYYTYSPFLANSLLLLTENQFEFINAITKNTYNNKLTESESILFHKFKNHFIISEVDFFVKADIQSPFTSLNLWLHTTDNCNCICNYCYIKNKGTKSITDELYNLLVEKITTTVIKHNIKRVLIRIAGGEPTLVNNWQFFLEKLLVELQNLDCELYPVILTNGTLIDKKLIDFLVRTKVPISISIDGLNNYQQINRPLINNKNSFSLVEKSINLLTQNNLNFNISIVLTNESIDGLIEFTSYLLKHNYSFKYSLVEQQLLNQEKVITILSKCYELIEIAIDNGYTKFHLHKFCDLHFDNFYNQTCSAGSEGLTLSTNGDFYFCQKHIGIKVPIGNIFEDADLISIAQRGINYYIESSYSDECILCSYKRICTSGCPLERSDGKDVYCEVYKFVIPIIYKLRAIDRLSKLLKISSIINSKLNSNL